MYEHLILQLKINEFQQLLQISLLIAAPSAASNADHNALQLRIMR
jgi:hypothetical protein